MPTAIRPFLGEHRAAILDEASTAVARAGLEHYQQAGADETRRRLEALYDAILESIDHHDLGRITAHAEAVAAERFHAGFGLSEVQTAFNVLEEATWRRILATVPPTELANAIGTVATLLGAGKDALARAYVGLASHERVPSLDLSRLFRGTSGF